MFLKCCYNLKTDKIDVYRYYFTDEICVFISL